MIVSGVGWRNLEKGISGAIGRVRVDVIFFVCFVNYAQQNDRKMVCDMP